MTDTDKALSHALREAATDVHAHLRTPGWHVDLTHQQLMQVYADIREATRLLRRVKGADPAGNGGEA